MFIWPLKSISTEWEGKGSRCGSLLTVKRNGTNSENTVGSRGLSATVEMEASRRGGYSFVGWTVTSCGQGLPCQIGQSSAGAVGDGAGCHHRQSAAFSTAVRMGGRILTLPSCNWVSVNLYAYFRHAAISVEVNKELQSDMGWSYRWLLYSNEVFWVGALRIARPKAHNQVHSLQKWVCIYVYYLF